MKTRNTIKKSEEDHAQTRHNLQKCRLSCGVMMWDKGTSRKHQFPANNGTNQMDMMSAYGPTLLNKATKQGMHNLYLCIMGSINRSNAPGESCGKRSSADGRPFKFAEGVS